MSKSCSRIRGSVFFVFFLVFLPALPLFAGLSEPGPDDFYLSTFDYCPDDDNKLTPGVYGCGLPELDWTKISPEPGNPLYSISGDNFYLLYDIYVAGQGVILNKNQNDWEESYRDESKTITGIWSAGENDVYAVGYHGLILHNDGNIWTEIDAGVDVNLSDISGSDVNDIYAVGGNDTVIHFDGSNWETSQLGFPPQTDETTSWGYMKKVFGFDDGTAVFLNSTEGVYLFDGTDWILTTSPLPEGKKRSSFPVSLYSLSDIWGTSISNLFLAAMDENYQGVVLHYDGSSWTRMDLGTEYPPSFDELLGFGADDIYAFAYSGRSIYHYDGNSWSPVEANNLMWPSTNIPYSVAGFYTWGFDAENIFAADINGTIYKYDGTGWTAENSATINNLMDTWVAGDSSIYAVGGGGTVLHYDGSAWSAMTSGTLENLEGVWGSEESDIFAVGDYGTVIHFNGETWSTMSAPGFDYSDIWGSSGSDVFAAGGYGGDIAHFDGHVWTAMDDGTDRRLRSIWGAGNDDVFTVGEAGTILHYDGTSWSAMDSGSEEELYDVRGTDGSHVYAVGANGTVLFYDGSSWSPFELVKSNESITDQIEYFSFESIVGIGDMELYLVDPKAIIRIHGNEWSIMERTYNLRSIDLISEDDFIAVGDAGKIITMETELTTHDGDNDGTADAYDGCPSDPEKIMPGEDGCAVIEPVSIAGNDEITEPSVSPGDVVDGKLSGELHYKAEFPAYDNPVDIWIFTFGPGEEGVSYGATRIANESGEFVDDDGYSYPKFATGATESISMSLGDAVDPCSGDQLGEEGINTRYGVYFLVVESDLISHIDGNVNQLLYILGSVEDKVLDYMWFDAVCE